MANHQQNVCITAIQFPTGFFASAPTAQWIAFLFDALHPSQQEAILERMKTMAEAQQQRPLVTIPGVNGESGL